MAVDLDEIDDVVLPELERWSTPGMSVAVLHDGQIESWGFGVCSIETGQPVTPATLFQIGSITKLFTTTLVMQLVDEGLVGLDQPVLRYLPDLQLADPEALRTLTLRQILSHAGGFFGDRFDDFGPADDALSRSVAAFGSLAQITRPGELFSYCNTGFQIAGLLVERVREQVFEHCVAARLFAPLGMAPACFAAREAITFPLAVGHNKLPGKPIEIARRYELTRCMASAGGIITTPAQLLRFAALQLNDGLVRQSLVGGSESNGVRAGLIGDGRAESTSGGTRLLSTAAAQAIREPQIVAGGFAEHYGIGWTLRTFDGVQVIGHGGSTNGFRAQLSLVPERGVAVAVLCNGNLGRAANRSVEEWLLERYAGLRPRQEPVAQISPQELAHYAGRYSQALSSATVAPAGDGLLLETTDRNPFDGSEVDWPPMRLEPLGDGIFRIVDGENQGEHVEFIANPDGSIRFLRYHGRLATPQPR